MWIILLIKHYWLYIKHPTNKAILDQNKGYDRKFIVKFNKRVE